MTSDELLFTDTLNKMTPLLETIVSLSRAGHISMMDQKFRMDSNQQAILSQEKQISENRGLLEDVTKKAASIIAMAEEKAFEIDKGIRERMANINHLEREAKRKVEEAERKVFEIRDKKVVKA